MPEDVAAHQENLAHRTVLDVSRVSVRAARIRWRGRTPASQSDPGHGPGTERGPPTRPRRTPVTRSPERQAPSCPPGSTRTSRQICPDRLPLRRYRRSPPATGSPSSGRSRRICNASTVPTSTSVSRQYAVSNSSRRSVSPSTRLSCSRVLQQALALTRPNRVPIQPPSTQPADDDHGLGRSAEGRAGSVAVQPRRR